MMLTTLPIFLLLMPQEIRCTIKLVHKNFVIEQGKAKFAVTTEPAKVATKSRLIFRKNDTYVVWDERGLSIRRKAKVATSRLAEFLPKNKPAQDASGLAGARRIGDDVFLLIRWGDGANVTYSEALFKVSLAGLEMKPKLITTLEAFTLSKAPIEDNLIIVGGSLGTVSTNKDTWGVTTIDLVQNKASFTKMGTRLQTAYPLTNKAICFSESTDYGTFVFGRVDWASLTRKVLYEDRNEVAPIDGESPLITVTVAETGRNLHNLESAAMRPIGPTTIVRRTPAGILLWSDSKEPKTALLVDPERFEVIAGWKAAAIEAGKPAVKPPPP